MKLFNSKAESAQLDGKSPATIAMAALFSGFCMYFILESYFFAVESYAGKAPYLVMGIFGFVTAAVTFFSLRKIEPNRGDTLSYALLMGLGIMFFLYTFIPRVNALVYDDTLQAYAYVLNSENVWIAKVADMPDLDIASNLWWEQFEPGDEYTFNLRQGGLGIWQINVDKIHDDQRAWGYAQLSSAYEQQFAQAIDL